MELNFDTGLKTYSVNGACEVTFNPTDSAFVEKLFRTFDALDQKQEQYRAEIDTLSDNREIFRVASEMDAGMRADIDAVFGKSVCAELFGDMNVYAMANGLPVWVNFLLSVIDEVDSAAQTEQKKTSSRVDKYIAKYRKYQK